MLFGQTRPQLSEKERGLLSYLFSSYFLLQANEPLQTQNKKNKGKKNHRMSEIYADDSRCCSEFFFFFFFLNVVESWLIKLTHSSKTLTRLLRPFNVFFSI